MQLLIDAAEFWPALERDIAQARRSVELQTLSFEGDQAGWQLARALIACAAPRKRVIVDSFSRHVTSGRWRNAPASYFDQELQHEIAETERMLQALRAAGVAVRFSNPVGAFMRRLPARNHKKTINIDNAIAYFGGINFTDHNFAWHDLMVRVDDARVATALRRDFNASWRGRHLSCYVRADGLELHTLDGSSNRAAFDMLFTRLHLAREQIVVHSPYLTFPFCDHLQRVAERGVRVTVLSPQENTIASLRRYIGWASARAQFRLHVLPGMSHLKAMLIDDSCLVLGSSNFDYLSYRLHQEVVAYVTDSQVIEDFRQRVLVPDLARSHVASDTPDDLQGRWLDAQLRMLAAALVLVSL